jgi:acetamidase/formamidase
VGWGHLCAGDGEVAGTAIETAMHCTMRLTVIKKGTPGNPGGRLPRYITPGPVYKPGGPQFGTTGVDSSMVAAARTALHEMIDYLGTVHGLSSYEALVLCSVAADFKIVEVVDMPNYVVSMHLPLAVLPAP